MKFLSRAAWIVGALLVAAIFVLLSLPTVNHHPNTQEPIAKIWIHQNAKVALIRFRIDCGRFPTTDEGLDALIRPPAGQSGWTGPYLEGAQVPLDPWGRPYRYRSPAARSSESYELWSEARDVLSDKDDIVSWK